MAPEVVEQSARTDFPSVVDPGLRALLLPDAEAETRRDDPVLRHAGRGRRVPRVGLLVRNMSTVIPGMRPSEPVVDMGAWIASGLYPRRRSCVDPVKYKVAWCRFCDTPVPWEGRKPYCDATSSAGQESCEVRYRSLKRHLRYERSRSRVDVDKQTILKLLHARSALIDSIQVFMDACAVERERGLGPGHFLLVYRSEVRDMLRDVRTISDTLRTLPRP